MRLEVRTGCPKATNGGCFQYPYVGCSEAAYGASEHHSKRVLRGTLGRGPLNNQIGSCIWDNVKDPIRSFKAPFVLRVWVDDVITPQIDERQFGGFAGTGTTDALVEMVHTWCEATDKPDTFLRVLLVDYSKAFDHINHKIPITKLYGMGLPAYLVRWMAAFLIDRQQSVKIGDTVSSIGYPNGGVPQGTLSGPKNFLVQINDLQTPRPMFKYADDCTEFDVCNNSSVPMLQESADIITYWSRNNDMRINATTTKEMVICFCRNDNHVASIPRIVIDNNDIERVTQAKVLGVTLSSDLT